jgi:hypothetical protein
MTSMDEDRWTEPGPNADADADVTRECVTDEAADMVLTLRLSFEDLGGQRW